MPDLSPFSPLLTAGRLLLAAYATVATVLATACLALHALTRLDRRARRRAHRRADRRPLFLRLDPEPDPT
jgi:hypothetical protein